MNVGDLHFLSSPGGIEAAAEAPIALHRLRQLGDPGSASGDAEHGRRWTIAGRYRQAADACRLGLDRGPSRPQARLGGDEVQGDLWNLASGRQASSAGSVERTVAVDQEAEPGIRQDQAAARNRRAYFRCRADFRAGFAADAAGGL